MHDEFLMLVTGHVLQLGDQYRSNDDGEPSGTAGKPIYSAIVSSGLDMVMVVVIRYSFCVKSQFVSY